MSHLRCQHLHEFLMNYLDGELEREVAAEFERHLELCPPCKDYLRTYEQTVALSRACGKDELPHVEPGCASTTESLTQAILLAQRVRSG